MINLLPTRQKEELLEEESFKLVLIFGTIFLSFLITFALILFSIRTIVAGRLNSQKITLTEKEKELNISQIENVEKEIKNYNLIFSRLNAFYQNQTDLTEMVEKISVLLPKSIYLTNLSFMPGDKNLSKVALTGFSPDRETLTEFKNNLEAEKSFVNIIFPQSNWLLLENFTINFEIKQ